MLNRVVLMGRLVRDPELRRTQSGIAVTSFGLAVERNYKSADGNRQTDFFDIVAWRNTAEFVCRYFTKGRMAAIDGRLEKREYTDRDGNRRTTVEVIADNVHFAGDAPRRDSQDGGGYGAPPPAGYGASQPPYGGSSFGGGASSSYGSGGAPYGGASDGGFSGSAGGEGGYNEMEENGELPF